MLRENELDKPEKGAEEDIKREPYSNQKRESSKLNFAHLDEETKEEEEHIEHENLRAHSFLVEASPLQWVNGRALLITARSLQAS